MVRRFRVTTYSGSVIDFEVEEREDGIYLKPVEGGEPVKLSIEKIDDNNYIVYIGHDKYRISLTGDTVYVNNEPVLLNNVTELIPLSVEARAESRRETVIVKKGEIRAPLSGKITEIKVRKGDRVREGDVLALMVSMKMVVEIKSNANGVVEKVLIEPGKAVKAGDLIIRIKVEEEK